jgi:nucleoside-diphosphate-sugar epimerase
VARILIVGGGCPGRRLAERLVQSDHAVRITTRTEAGRAEIEALGAECWIGTPDRLATLRGSLENVTVACWMLAGARGSAEELAALHSSRLEFFLGQAIDTTVRGLIYDVSAAGGSPAAPEGRGVSADLLAAGERMFRSLSELNAIPAVVLDRGGEGREAWVATAGEAVASLLGSSGR